MPRPNELTPASLPEDVRRLDGFLQRVERLRIEDLPMFAAVPGDAAAHTRALDEADVIASERGRDGVLADGRRRVAEWLARLYGAQQFYPEWAGTAWGKSTGTSLDRVRLARSLTDAVTALILWDAIDTESRDELLGPWVELVA